MTDQMEVPPMTRREREIAEHADARLGMRLGVDPIPGIELDIRYLLDVIALLRADLQVAITRATVWRRHGQAETERADYLEARTVPDAAVR